MLCLSIIVTLFAIRFHLLVVLAALLLSLLYLPFFAFLAAFYCVFSTSCLSLASLFASLSQPLSLPAPPLVLSLR